MTMTIFHQSLGDLGMRSGVNFWAFPRLPLIFIFPCMNATWGSSFPLAIPIISLSRRMKVVSAFPTFPLVIFPRLSAFIPTWAVFEVDSEDCRRVSLLLSDFKEENGLYFLYDISSVGLEMFAHLVEEFFRLKAHFLDFYYYKAFVLTDAIISPFFNNLRVKWDNLSSVFFFFWQPLTSLPKIPTTSSRHPSLAITGISSMDLGMATLRSPPHFQADVPPMIPNTTSSYSQGRRY